MDRCSIPSYTSQLCRSKSGPTQTSNNSGNCLMPLANHLWVDWCSSVIFLPSCNLQVLSGVAGTFDSRRGVTKGITAHGQLLSSADERKFIRDGSGYMIIPEEYLFSSFLESLLDDKINIQIECEPFVDHMKKPMKGIKRELDRRRKRSSPTHNPTKRKSTLDGAYAKRAKNNGAGSGECSHNNNDDLDDLEHQEGYVHSDSGMLHAMEIDGVDCPLDLSDVLEDIDEDVEFTEGDTEMAKYLEKGLLNADAATFFEGIQWMYDGGFIKKVALLKPHETKNDRSAVDIIKNDNFEMHPFVERVAREYIPQETREKQSEKALLRTYVCMRNRIGVQDIAKRDMLSILGNPVRHVARCCSCVLLLSGFTVVTHPC